MQWYCALTEHLLNKNNTVSEKEFKTIQDLLQEQVIEFYKLLLLYQMRSVCSYFRNQGLVFLRGLVHLDNWDDDIQSVKNAEDTLLKDWEKYNKIKAEELSTHLVELTSRTEGLLGDIRQDLREFIDQQQKIQAESTNKECLRDLRVVNPQDDMNRIEDEKEELVFDAYKWILEDKKYAAFTDWGESSLPPCRVLWIRGHAGTGKTMLLIGIIRELSGQPAVLTPSLSYFFCQGQGKTDQPLNNATATLRSLIWMLVIQQPHLISHLQADYSYGGRDLFTDTNTLVAMSRLFKNMLKDAGPVYFIVDALDECDQGLEALVKCISTSLTISNKVRWLVSSRPEVDAFSQFNNPDISSVVDLNAQSPEGPVDIYIRHKLSALKAKKGYTEKVMAQITVEVHQRAGNIFLWVALVFQKLGKVHGSNAVKTIKEIPSGLSKLYDHMMTKIEKVEMIEPQDCKNTLVAISLTYRPLTLSELAVLAGLSHDITQIAVEECGSFLTTKGETIYPIHQSAKDYLDTNRSRLQPGGVAQAHADITRRSIDAMSSILERDLYRLGNYGLESKDITPPDGDPLAPVRYSCVHWLDHLRHAIEASPGSGRDLCELVFNFFQEHYLHWLESLSLLHRLSDGIFSVTKLLNVVKVCW
jgi:N-terminal domain of NWD NACHT-NTPase/NACHT domain